MSAAAVDCPFCGRPLVELVVPGSRRLPVAGGAPVPSVYALCECGGEVRWVAGDGEGRVLAARVPRRLTVWVGERR